VPTCTLAGCTGRDVEFGDVIAGDVLEMHHECPQRVAVGGDQDVQFGTQLGNDDVVPVGQHTSHDIGQALGGRQHVGRQQAVALVVDRVLWTVAVDGGRRHVVAAAPQFDLLGAVALGGLSLVEPLQRAVVTFVEAPVALHRQPGHVHCRKREVGREHGPHLDRRV